MALYRYPGTPHNLIIYFSDRAGWRQDFDGAASGAAWPDRVVAGIDLPRLTKNLAVSGRCVDYAGALKTLSAAIAREVKAPVDEQPMLVGEGDGGMLAYVAAVQGPTSVQAVITQDFCPVLAAPPPCDGPTGPIAEGAPDALSLKPSAALKAPFITIADPASCKSDLTAFTDALPDGRIVPPEPTQAVDLMNSVIIQTNARTSVGATTDVEDLRGIPVVEVPIERKSDDRLAIVLTGDGGWSDIDKDIGERLAKEGIAVVGFNSLKYFWERQSPDKSAADLDRVIRYYMSAWGRQRVLLVGFSFGADVLPSLFERLPADLQERTSLMALLSPSPHASFEISVGGWVGVENHDGPELAPTMDKLKVPMLCVQGTEQEDKPCPLVTNTGLEIMTLKGDHHFDGVYEPIAARIVAKTKKTPG